MGVPLPHAAVSAFVAIDLTKDNILVRILLNTYDLISHISFASITISLIEVINP